MLKTLANAWKIPDMRKKILWTVLLLIVFRFGSIIPIPGLDKEVLQQLVESGANSLFGFFNIMSGGAFENATIFAMSITPYINSSIIMNLLTVAIPALERLSKEGEEGRKKIAQITRYVTVILAFIQASGLYAALQASIKNPGLLSFVTITLTFTAGTAFLMWLGENLELCGCRVVADHDACRMDLESRDWPYVVVSALYTMLYCICLLWTECEDDNFLRVKDSGDTY